MVDIDMLWHDAVAEIEGLREQLHYAKGTCDLAMKHRDIAEQALATERERCALVAETCPRTDMDGVSVAYWIAAAIRRGDRESAGNPDEGLPTAEYVKRILR